MQTPQTRAEWRQGAEYRDFADDEMLLALLDDLDEALQAIERVCDAGLLEDEEDAECHIEGIPGYEFDAKWGDVSIAQTIERLRAVLPRRE